MMRKKNGDERKIASMSVKDAKFILRAIYDQNSPQLRQASNVLRNAILAAQAAPAAGPTSSRTPGPQTPSSTGGTGYETANTGGTGHTPAYFTPSPSAKKGPKQK